MTIKSTGTGFPVNITPEFGFPPESAFPVKQTETIDGNVLPTYKENDPAFKRIIREIDSVNWNSKGSYYFSLNTLLPNGKVTFGIDKTVSRKYFSEGSNDIVWLNIAPNNISISNVFATIVTATNDGILEENNGVVFRNIRISGTTGLLPKRNSQKRYTKPKTAGEAVSFLAANLFPSVTGAVSNAFNSVKKAIGINKDSTLKDNISKNEKALKRTGYYQFWHLHNYLLAYSEIKKKKEAQDIVLGFGSTKDGITYVVSPVSFDISRDSGNPLLYNYNIVLKAWALVDLTLPFEPDDIDKLQIPIPSKPALIKSVLSGIQDMRDAVSSVQNVLLAINSDNSDVQNYINVVGDSILLYKDMVGVANTFNDLVGILKNNANLILSGSRNSLSRELNNQVQKGDETAVSLSKSFANVENLGNKSSDFNTKGAVETLKKAIDTPSISNNIDLSDANLPNTIQSKINDKIEAAKTISAGQIKDLADKTQNLSDSIAASTGPLHPQYAKTYKLSLPSGNRPLTEEDIILMAHLQEARTGYISTLATGEIFKERNPDPFLNANKVIDPTEQLPTPSSSFAVQFERGSSMERMAQKFLGDAARAKEIIILNDLKPPYIDEDGFNRNIQFAQGRQCIVSDITNLAINQFITINGTNLVLTKRQIINIEKLGPTEYRITVNGLANLDNFTIATSPYIHARIPSTIGSGDTILIPSSETLSEVPERPTALSTRLSAAEKVFKVDVALDKNGDILVNKNSDVHRSFGYDNAVQAIRIALETEQGELEQHPNFGLGVPIGSRNSDITPADIQKMVRNQVSNDPRFVDVNSTVQVQGSTTRLFITAKGASGTGKIPVTFDIGRDS